MSHVPHELAEEFADQTEKLHDLKLNNPHFARLAVEYHTINREIHRIETGVEATSEMYETGLRKKRLHLKDQIASIVSKS